MTFQTPIQTPKPHHPMHVTSGAFTVMGTSASRQSSGSVGMSSAASHHHQMGSHHHHHQMSAHHGTVSQMSIPYSPIARMDPVSPVSLVVGRNGHFWSLYHHNFFFFAGDITSALLSDQHGTRRVSRQPWCLGWRCHARRSPCAPSGNVCRHN